MLRTAISLPVFGLLLFRLVKALPMDRYDEAGAHSSHRPAAWALDFSTPPADMEPADFEILRALSADFSSPDPTASHDESQGSNNLPRPGSTASLVDTDNAIARHKATTSIVRGRIGHPEPYTLTLLPYYAPFRDHHRSLTHDDSPQIPSRIVNAFGGKLRWFPATTSRETLVPHNWHNRSPYNLYSRRLPIAIHKDGERLSVHMTQHNVPPRTAGLTQGTEFWRKPYYGFWGLPEKPEGDLLPIVFYGLGTLETQDNEAVDRHLAPLIQELEGKAKV
ncbi:hypothetical protein PSEUBRA_005090 [Kalmanozyma brasiliensis GHG001]|uniref:uncharacterized protein n=1 Tax=Kalmanozyma brasiliensis (strain GHG001) TaxID=1365824 RepID=UPI002867BF42|nr:uncharacterized protein PSEUBRA_005090 [Kalmanozyma brasiliensis GHG001]KAF6767475.1 hypothetical protein PSEUBRA_005090 [Kalmanozyma brasiliensis GHG001]